MDKFQQSLPMMLYQTLDKIIPQFRAAFKQYDISEQQWRILRVLRENNECTTAELSNKTLLPPPSMVGIIDRMIDKKLVARARCNQDRRKVHIRLTEKGKKLQQKISPKIDEVYAGIVSKCDRKEWQTMIQTLQSIIDADACQ